MDNYFIPLWTITFPESKDLVDFRQNAKISFEKETKRLSPPPQFNNPSAMLEFLDALNSSFKKASEVFFDQIEKTPEMEQKLQEIRQKFDALQHWIDMIKSLFNTRPPSS